MAINVIKKPQKYTPSDDAIIFQIESTFTNVIYFKVEVKEAVSNAIIGEFEIYATPDYANGSFIDLSRILSNAVKWQVNNTINILTLPLTRPLLKYIVSFTEMGVVGGAIVELSPTVNYPDVFITWNAELGRIRFNSFIYTAYTITSGLPASFLTYKPNNITVNDISSEQLIFMHDEEDVLNVVIKTYDIAGTLLNTYTDGISGLSTDKIFRIQVSPKSLQQTLLVDLTNVHHYTVHLEDETNTRKTEIRKYFYKELPCQLHPQNLFWVNSLGGIDTYQFVNVTETDNITRNIIKKNPYKIYNGYYTDRQGDIMNPSEEIVDLTQEGQYTANSTFLSDAEAVWLNELFKSDQVFVELDDNVLVPVIVTNTSYQIQKQYMNRSSYITTTVTYKLNGELIPSESTAYGTGFGNGQFQVDFIDDQMNTN